MGLPHSQVTCDMYRANNISTCVQQWEHFVCAWFHGEIRIRSFCTNPQFMTNKENDYS